MLSQSRTQTVWTEGEWINPKKSSWSSRERLECRMRLGEVDTNGYQKTTQENTADYERRRSRKPRRPRVRWEDYMKTVYTTRRDDTCRRWVADSGQWRAAIPRTMPSNMVHKTLSLRDTRGREGHFSQILYLTKVQNATAIRFCRGYLTQLDSDFWQRRSIKL